MLRLLLLRRRWHTRSAGCRRSPAGSTGCCLYKDLTTCILIPLSDPTGWKLRRRLSHFVVSTDEHLLGGAKRQMDKGVVMMMTMRRMEGRFESE